MTALHTAASHGSVQVCRLLLDRGCEIRCLDEEDMTPLHFAAMEGHLGKTTMFCLTMRWGYSLANPLVRGFKFDTAF